MSLVNYTKSSTLDTYLLKLSDFYIYNLISHVGDCVALVSL